MISTTHELLVTLFPPGLVREREVLTCMWLLTSPHVSLISLISGLESCDLWPLGCLTAPVPQADVSPRCHVSSTPLFTVTVVSGCLAPQSPWLLPREGIREVGEATCHCPTAMERVEGLGLSMTAGNTTHGAAKDHSNGGERKRKPDEMTAPLQRVTTLDPSKWKTVPMETAKSLRTNFPSAKPGASNYMKWLDNQSVSNTPKTP